jgi:hypothetical protein
MSWQSATHPKSPHSRARVTQGNGFHQAQPCESGGTGDPSAP